MVPCSVENLIFNSNTIILTVYTSYFSVKSYSVLEDWKVANSRPYIVTLYLNELDIITSFETKLKVSSMEILDLCLQQQHNQTQGGDPKVFNKTTQNKCIK